MLLLGFVNHDLRSGVQHTRQQTFHSHCVAAYPAAFKEVAITVPLLIAEAEVMFTVFAMKNRFKRLELDTIFFVDISVSFFDITDYILTGSVGKRVALEHWSEQFFHRHNMRANMLGVETGAGT